MTGLALGKPTGHSCVVVKRPRLRHICARSPGRLKFAAARAPEIRLCEAPNLVAHPPENRRRVVERAPSWEYLLGLLGGKHLQLKYRAVLQWSRSTTMGSAQQKALCSTGARFCSAH